MTRSKVLEMASTACLKELYSKAQPAVTWEDFVGQNKMYSNKYKAWERYHKPSKQDALSEEELKEFSVYPGEWKDKSRNDCIGPAPYEFYYLPKDVFKEIADSYVDAYNIDAHQNLLDIIDILKNYCKDPIEEAYIEESDGGRHRGYIHPLPIQSFIASILKGYYDDSECGAHETVAKELCEEFFHYLDKAGKFYTWNHDLSSFNTAVYLGPSPCSNKNTVIENWKKYRNKDITIDDSIYIEDEEN